MRFGVHGLLLLLWYFTGTVPVVDQSLAMHMFDEGNMLRFSCICITTLQAVIIVTTLQAVIIVTTLLAVITVINSSSSKGGQERISYHALE